MVADPPYGETSLAWDRWPDGWLDAAAGVTKSLWCFGSLRMFGEHWQEFRAGWTFSQDIVWEKHNGSGFAADRFKRVHEAAAHWYRGRWDAVWHDVPRLPGEFDPKGRTTSFKRPGKRAAHAGAIGEHIYVDDGMRLARSVIYQRSMHHSAIHRTQKPVPLLDLMIRYASPPGGLVVDPFAGSGSSLDAARCSGRRAIGIEADEKYIERAALRLSQMAMVTP